MSGKRKGPSRQQQHCLRCGEKFADASAYGNGYKLCEECMEREEEAG